MKSFLTDFNKIKNYLENNINFSFTSFTKQKIRTK